MIRESKKDSRMPQRCFFFPKDLALKVYLINTIPGIQNIKQTKQRLNLCKNANGRQKIESLQIYRIDNTRQWFQEKWLRSVSNES